MKNYLFILLVIVIVSGCTNQAQLSKEEFAQKTSIAAQGIHSYREQEVTDISIEIEARGAKQTMQTQTILKASIDSDRKMMESNTTTIKQGQTESSRSFVINNTVYAMYNGQWVKRDMENSTWNTQNQYSNILQLLDNSRIEALPEEIIDGKPYYVVNVIPDASKLIDLFGQSKVPGIKAQIDDSIKEFTIKFWIQKDTFLATKVFVTARIETVATGSSVKMLMTMDLQTFDHNRPMNIELPQEARRAVDIMNLDLTQKKASGVRISSLTSAQKTILSGDILKAEKLDQNVSLSIDSIRQQNDPILENITRNLKRLYSVSKARFLAVKSDLERKDESLDEESLKFEEDINGELALADDLVYYGYGSDLYNQSLLLKKDLEHFKIRYRKYMDDLETALKIDFHDLDQDGISNIYDTDADGDGIADINDTDTDNDGIPNTNDYVESQYRTYLEQTYGIYDSSLRAEEETGYFSIIYVAPKNPTYKEFERIFKESQLFEDTADAWNDYITLSHDLPIVFGECGQENAFYDPETKSIIMCYELIGKFGTIFGPYSKTNEELGTKMLHSTYFVLYHETGHALISLLNLPTTGKEEDVADQVATWILLQNGDEGEQAAIDGANAFLLLGSEEGTENLAYWDTHSLSTQRFYNIICWVYGKDPEKYSYLVEDGTLPEARAAYCPQEYAKMADSLGYLLKPYLK